MQEMLAPTSLIMEWDLDKVALITDGRFSETTRGASIGLLAQKQLKVEMMVYYKMEIL